MFIREHESETLKGSIIIDKVLKELNEIVEHEIKKALNYTNKKIESITILNALHCFGGIASSNTLTSTTYSTILKDYKIEIKINGYLSKIIDSAFNVLAEEYDNVGYVVDKIDTITEKGFRIYI